ncbi:hypothetical protein DINM_021245 [Dirofilaria immitis]|nr:hypothetical protein [Dirofilaria immitis]
MKVGFVCRRARVRREKGGGGGLAFNSFSTAPFFEDLYINCTMSRRIATLHSSEKSRSRSSSPPNDDEKRQQGFFVGGSEQSGNLVLGPDSTHNEDIVSKFFSSARAHGAESLTPEENARFGTRDAVKFASGSKGYRLGNTIQPSELVESNISSDSVPQEVTLIMWENGFTVDGGPLRLYSDLPNHSFLHSISEAVTVFIELSVITVAEAFSVLVIILTKQNGMHIPNEIIRQYPGKTIDIRMERRYQPYVVKSKPFSGQGQRLGEIVPTIVSAGNLEQNTNNDANPANSECVDFHCVKKAQETIKLTNEEPVTHVQIRLPSGRRIVGQFNHNHTVGDIRNFLIIIKYALYSFPNAVGYDCVSSATTKHNIKCCNIFSAAPDYAFVPFNLMTTFPNKVIEQENVSLKEADRLIQSRIPTAVNMIFVDLIHAGKASDFPFIPMSLKEIFGLQYGQNSSKLLKVAVAGWVSRRNDNSYFIPRNRWVEYPEHVWLEYDSSQIPAEWHMWLHHITDETPVQNPPKQRKWMLDHEETLTLLENRKYYPYSTTRQKLSLWNPKTTTWKARVLSDIESSFIGDIMKDGFEHNKSGELRAH